MELIILSENLYEWRARQQTQIHIRDGISVLKTYFLFGSGSGDASSAENDAA